MRREQETENGCSNAESVSTGLQSRSSPDLTGRTDLNGDVTSVDADTGNGGAEIARRRCRSIKTVSYQKSQIYRKLRIRNDLTF
ncbi:TPA: response regulator transcription factor [Escherichia coli]|nr:response regulator transcription factor [Escherichia coli]HBA8029074.1 response regulator transcription factor [Escherichia coli]HBA8043634.1 response regulator transcription factor [Escherichia coli]HBA8936674.1 response regulator transcription factor [Escherichia coli]HBA8978526.1 response regulator transcription factor [Escherichia coli]